MNAGVSKILSKTDIEAFDSNKGFKNQEGKNILATFGIDEAIFCDVFNNYGKQNFQAKSGAVTLSSSQKASLTNLLSTGIGSGYWMVHGQPNGDVNFYYMDGAKNKTASKAPGSVQINYGGTTGKGKRVDVKFSTDYYDFKVNIRNKQRGLYPSHIMLDYTTKAAIGKTPINNSSDPTNF
jgi:hypothetical protein